MVGFGVAGYTGSIEQGIEQPQGATPMTTNQNDARLLTDRQLDAVAAGVVYEKIEDTRFPHVPPKASWVLKNVMVSDFRTNSHTSLMGDGAVRF